MSDKATKIQHSIRWYSISALLLTGFVIALVIILPLQSRLFDMQKKHLVYSRDVGALVVSSCFTRLKEIAKQISMQSDGRQLMSDYTEKKISITRLQKSLDVVFKNAVLIHPDLTAITRFSNDQKRIVSAGDEIASTTLMKNVLQNHLQIDGPLIAKHKSYILVVSPVINTQGVKVGDDIFTFQLNTLEKMIHEKMISQLGKTSIFYIHNHQLHWLFLNNGRVKLNDFLKSVPLDQILIHSVVTKKTGMISEIFHHEGIVVTYAPISQMPWGVVVIADKMDLFHAIEHMVLILIVIVLTILFLFAIGLSTVLKPLSGKLILENEELKELLDKSNKELKTLNDQLYQLAMVDSLTNTLTRRAFYERFEAEIFRSKRYKRTFTLLFMDIDKFKLINDTFGHDTGDFLLKEFSKRIFSFTRKEDIFARLGGDEFALLLPEKSDPHTITDIISRIREHISKPMHFNGNQLTITISIGIATYPTDGETIDSLLKVADQYMYTDKSKK